MALVSAALFTGIWWHLFQAATSGNSVVELQSGFCYLLLPLALPLLYLFIALDKRLRPAYRATFRRVQGTAFVTVVVILLGVGWLAEMHVSSRLEEQGYKICERKHYGLRSVLLIYAKDHSLCPESSSPQ